MPHTLADLDAMTPDEAQGLSLTHSGTICWT